MAKILFMEDDTLFFQTLKEFLEEEGFEVVGAKDGEEALEKSFNENFDLYLLDVNVPFINGFDFLKSLRDAGDRTPAFFITALRDVKSVSKGFDSGADDFIKKPFDEEELVVRIKAALKRKYDTLEYKDILYDPIVKRVFKNGKEVDLQAVERDIFDLLIKNVGKSVRKERFYEVMEKDSALALRVHIANLKKKLSIDISNIRGIGYRLEKV